MLIFFEPHDAVESMSEAEGLACPRRYAAP